MADGDISRGHRPITARQLARSLGISQSTVSRAFSPTASVSPAMRARVLQQAEWVKYQPNVIARSLSTRRTGIVGIVMANMTNPFYPEVLELLSRGLQEIGLRTLLFNVPPGHDVDAVLPLLLQYQVDAVVVTSATISSAMARDWTATGRSAVLFNRTVPEADIASVLCDNVGGARTLADHLVDSGHRRVAYAAGRPDTSTNVDRERGFLERLAERGVPLYARAGGEEYDYASGCRAAIALAPAGPDCIFFANDIMALGGMDALRTTLGLHVPQDVSVVGFDDIEMAGWPTYELTTVRQPVQAMIDLTIQLVLDSLNNRGNSVVAHVVPGPLIVRKSTMTRS
ncbi:MAG: LacI family DNA-binding transcriptional regulator [Acetobacteraceae bacterium]